MHASMKGSETERKRVSSTHQAKIYLIFFLQISFRREKFNIYGDTTHYCIKKNTNTKTKKGL